MGSDIQVGNIDAGRDVTVAGRDIVSYKDPEAALAAWTKVQSEVAAMARELQGSNAPATEDVIYSLQVIRREIGEDKEPRPSAVRLAMETIGRYLPDAIEMMTPVLLAIIPGLVT